jgi:hypothetical protein
MTKLTVAFRNFANEPTNADDSPRSLCVGTCRLGVSVHFTLGAQIFFLRDVKNAFMGTDNFKFIYRVKVDSKNDDDDDNNNNK